MVENATGLFLALELDGVDESVHRLREAVTAAERAGFALVTFGDAVDGPDRLDAGTRAAFVSSATDAVGLAPTVQTLTTEPFFLATQLASLDHATLGRAAWVVGADNSSTAHEAAGSAVREEDSITAEIRDVIDVSRRLWDSWEDGAVIRDVASGRYLDPDKVHHVRFEGRFFDIVGPLITPRSPQGQVVVIADASLGVTDLIDVALVSGETVDEIDAQARAARSAGAPLVFADGPADDLLASLAGVVDGVRLHPSSATPEAIAAQVDSIERRVSVRRPSAGRTLRESLGLAHAPNRYAVTTSASGSEL